MIYPASGPLGQPFGADPETYAPFGLKGHNGQDWPVPTGTAILAPEDAVVIMAGDNLHDQYTQALVTGLSVVLQGEYEHWLLHNSQLLVKPGDEVHEGQVIAYSGYSGFVEPPGEPGAHCHWGVRPRNPDTANGYRGFIDPLSVKEDEMPNGGDVDNAYLAANGRKASDKEKQDYTTKPWGADDGLFYGKTLVDLRNVRKALETTQNNAGAAAKLDEIKKIVGV